MQGYLKPLARGHHQRELTRTYMCGLCHLFGEHYGFIYRLFAQPDLVFLNVFLDAVDQRPAPVVNKTSTYWYPRVSRFPAQRSWRNHTTRWPARLMLRVPLTVRAPPTVKLLSVRARRSRTNSVSPRPRMAWGTGKMRCRVASGTAVAGVSPTETSMKTGSASRTWSVKGPPAQKTPTPPPAPRQTPGHCQWGSGLRSFPFATRCKAAVGPGHQQRAGVWELGAGWRGPRSRQPSGAKGWPWAPVTVSNPLIPFRKNPPCAGGRGTLTASSHG